MDMDFDPPGSAMGGDSNPTFGSAQPSYPTSSAQPSYQSSVAQPSYQSGGAQPSYPSGSAQPSYQSSVAQPSYQSGTAQPSYQNGDTEQGSFGNPASNAEEQEAYSPGPAPHYSPLSDGGPGIGYSETCMLWAAVNDQACASCVEFIWLFARSVLEQDCQNAMMHTNVCCAESMSIRLHMPCYKTSSVCVTAAT